MPIIKQGNSLWKFHMTTNDHYKKSDFVLLKSLVPFYGQVNKALRSIFHWLVSLLVFLLLGMHKQTVFKLLYYVLYITVNRKNEQVKTHNRLKYVKI